MPASTLKAPPSRAAGAIPTVDPTPGPGDITSFSQVKGGPPAPHPSLEPRADTTAKPSTTTTTQPPTTTSGAREVQLDGPSDPNRANQIPDSVWSDLSKFADPDPDPDPKAGGAPAAPKPAEVAPAETPLEPVEGKESGLEDAELEKQVQAFKTLKEVKTAHKEALKREKAWAREKAEVQSKLAALEAKAKAVDPEATKALTTELETVRKQATELEAKVRTLDYTKSTEFHDNFTKPIAKAFEAAVADLEEMLVEENGQMRKATTADFQELLQLPLHQATAKAKEKFGDLSAEVLAHRRGIIQLKRAEGEAIKNAATAAEEARQRQAVEQTQKLERIQASFKQRSGELEAKFPELFKAREGDQEGNDLLANGHKLLGALEDPALDDDTRVKIATEVRYRAASYGRLLRDFKRSQAELAVANEKLKGFDRSAPKEGLTAPGGPAEAPTDPMERALREIDKMATTM